MLEGKIGNLYVVDGNYRVLVGTTDNAGVYKFISKDDSCQPWLARMGSCEEAVAIPKSVAKKIIELLEDSEEDIISVLQESLEA